MHDPRRLLALGFGILACLSLHAALAADPGEKISFSSRDSCSASGCVMEFQVKAKGALAYVEVKYASHAEHVGKPEGTTEYLLFDFNNLTIKTLYPKAKAYALATCADARKVPIYQMIQELRAKAVKEFEASASYHGTLFQAKTVTTTFENSEKSAKFKDSDVSVPAGFKRLDDNAGVTNNLIANQPGTQGGASPGINTPRTGNPSTGAPVGLPGIGP